MNRNHKARVMKPGKREGGKGLNKDGAVDVLLCNKGCIMAICCGAVGTGGCRGEVMIIVEPYRKEEPYIKLQKDSNVNTVLLNHVIGAYDTNKKVRISFGKCCILPHILG